MGTALRASRVNRAGSSILYILTGKPNRFHGSLKVAVGALGKQTIKLGCCGRLPARGKI